MRISLWMMVAFWCSVGIATAQSQSAGAVDERPVALVVRTRSSDAARCFDTDALQQRIARYGGTHGAKAVELQLELYVDSPDTAELRIFRGDVLVSRRRFEHLPTSCANRRDTVALSIALALEGAMQQLAAANTNDAADIASVTPESAAGAIDRGPPPGTLDAQRATVAAASAQNKVAKETAEAERQSERAASELPTTPESADTTAASSPMEGSPTTSERGPQDSDEDVSDAADHRKAQSGPAMGLHLGGRWLAEALPSPVWTGVLGLELWLNRRIAFDLSAFVSTLGNSSFAGARAQTQLVGGELFGCTAWKLGRFAAQGCLGATAAACDARGRDYPVAMPAATLLWAASAARLALRWPDNQLISLRLVLQANVNLMRPVLRVDDSSEQLKPAWVGGAAGLDVILALE
jgi:hypothetical protein